MDGAEKQKMNTILYFGTKKKKGLCEFSNVNTKNLP